MSVFDLFRGFFGVPGGNFHDEDVFHHDGFMGGQQDPFDGAFRFGFSFGPEGMRVQEPPVFGHILREMEEIFSQMGRWESGHFGQVMPPPAAPDRGGNPLRDFMLKHPDRAPPHGSPLPPPHGSPRPPLSPFHDWTPFSKVNDDLRRDGVSSGGLDQILAPPSGQKPDQPRSRSFFQSVVVSKVLRPDGVGRRSRTRGDHRDPCLAAGGPQGSSDMRDDDSLFSRFFGGFK
uniref:HCLS1 associated protein X-1 n=1 Tax=Oryzias sinensis TaxID=183150 RepID=A0A8C7WTD2_9TELE